jgi:hypothetical protein
LKALGSGRRRRWWVGSATRVISVLTVIGMLAVAGVIGRRSSGDRVLAVPRGILAVSSIVCADGRAGFACRSLGQAIASGVSR